MTPTEQDLRQVLGEQATAFAHTLDTAKLRTRIARRTAARRTGAVATVVGAALAVMLGVSALPLGDATSPTGVSAPGSSTPTVGPSVSRTDEPSTPTLRGRPLLKQRRLAYSLEPCVLDCATTLTALLTLQSPDDVLALTIDKELEFGTFIRRSLKIDGQIVGSGDLATREEVEASRFPLWAVPDYSYDGDPARVSETRDWRSMGIQPGQTFTLTLKLEYKVPSLPGSNGLTPDPSYPQHITGHVIVGLYGPPAETAQP